MSKVVKYEDVAGSGPLVVTSPQTLRRLERQQRTAKRADPVISADQWAQWMNFNGNSYPLGVQTTMSGEKQQIETGFSGYARSIYKSNGVIFACMDVREKLFSEARFQFQELRKGRPGDLFGNDALSILETPWPGGTTGDLLGGAIQTADLAGSYFCTIVDGQVRDLRPDWTDIVLGSRVKGEMLPIGHPRTELVGYTYWPGGRYSGNEPIIFLPEQVCHFAPKRDPEARYRGMSWVTPIVREVMGDNAATDHKLKFFENAATPNMVVKMDAAVTQANAEIWFDAFKEQHEGAFNAYKTLFLGPGADVTPVGTNFQQLEFKVTQGAGETRIAAAASVPPVIVGLSEGLQAATYSNYELAMRRFTDLTMRPLWRNMAGSLARIIKVPPNSRLWYDDRDVPALADDETKRAAIQQTQSQTLHTYIAAGFEPDSAVEAVIAGDLRRLAHTGMYSVQLLPQGTVAEGKGAVVSGTVSPTDATTNGAAA